MGKEVEGERQTCTTARMEPRVRRFCSEHSTLSDADQNQPWFRWNLRVLRRLPKTSLLREPGSRESHREQHHRASGNEWKIGHSIRLRVRGCRYHQRHDQVQRLGPLLGGQRREPETVPACAKSVLRRHPLRQISTETVPLCAKSVPRRYPRVPN
eukprot:2700945-Rhodomonas_salina.1